MTVEELIALLQTYSPTATVFVQEGLVVDATYEHGQVHLVGDYDDEDEL